MLLQKVHDSQLMQWQPSQGNVYHIDTSARAVYVVVQVGNTVVHHFILDAFDYLHWPPMVLVICHTIANSLVYSPSAHLVLMVCVILCEERVAV